MSVQIEAPPGFSLESRLRDAESGLTLAVFRDGSGHRRAWLLDDAGNVRAHGADQLDAGMRDALAALVRDTARLAWSRLVLDPRPALSDPDRARLRLGAAAALIVAPDANAAGLAGRPAYLDVPSSIDAEAMDPALFPAHPGATTALLADLFARDCLHELGRFIRTGKLTLPSPFDGAILESDAALALNAGANAFRFVAPAQGGTVFYVILSLWSIDFAAVCIPRAGLTIFPFQSTELHLREGFLPQGVETGILRHALVHGPALADYLAAPARKPGLVYHQDHLGHHLYNELGGLHTVLEGLPADVVPRIFLPQGRMTEMYGRVDALFPEAAGKVDRTPRDGDSVAEAAYAERLTLARPTAEYVPRDLARRIIANADADPALDADRALHSRLRAEGARLVVLGLRTENRAPVDQVGFFSTVIDALHERLPNLALVVDGHDALPGAPGAMFISHVEHAAARAPVAVEREILAALEARCGGRDGLHVISTVGASMSRTLFWCSRAALVVTPWGAGLAKYSWICNLPSLVVSNRHVLLHDPGQRQIYEQARYFRGAPAPVTLFRPEDVEDDPEAPLLIGLSDASRWNFRVRPESIRPRVEEALASLRPEERSLA